MRRILRQTILTVIGLAIGFICGVYAATKNVEKYKKLTAYTAFGVVEQSVVRQFCAQHGSVREVIADQLRFLEEIRTTVDVSFYKSCKLRTLTRLASASSNELSDNSAEWASAVKFCIDSGFTYCSKRELNQLWGTSSRECLNTNSTVRTR